MAGDTTITVVGNLTDDPELRVTHQSGAAVANFRIASTPRYLDRQSGEWRDGDPLFLSCTVWREMAENVSESLKRGARVVVTGRLRQRSYETPQGDKRTVVELEVDEIGPSLRYARAKVMKLTRATEPGNGTRSRDDQWSTAAPARTATAHTAGPATAEDPFATTARTSTGEGGAGFDDEPPF